MLDGARAPTLYADLPHRHAPLRRRKAVRFPVVAFQGNAPAKFAQDVP